MSRGQGGGNPVLRDGRRYDSQAAFAREIGVTRSVVSKALDAGTLENCGKRNKPKVYQGVEYPSLSAASAILNIPYGVLYKRIARASRK